MKIVIISRQCYNFHAYSKHFPTVESVINTIVIFSNSMYLLLPSSYSIQLNSLRDLIVLISVHNSLSLALRGPLGILWLWSHIQAFCGADQALYSSFRGTPTWTLSPPRFHVILPTSSSYWVTIPQWSCIWPRDLGNLDSGLVFLDIFYCQLGLTFGLG